MVTTRIRQASRSYRPLKLGLSGISGSGKTLGALKIAYGLCGDWSKICVIDTENKSADLYAHLGPYAKMDLEDCSPQGYMAAIKEVESEGFKVCIIDSLSHEWLSALDLVEKTSQTSTSRNSFTAWGKVTPLHDAFVQSWLKSPMHVIGTLRQKDEYVIEQNDKGKSVPKKVGLKSVQRDGVGFEFDLWFMIHDSHLCTVEKDRTQLFDGKPPFMLSKDTGRSLLEWSNKSTIAPMGASYPGIIVNGIYQIIASKINLILDTDKRMSVSKFVLEHRDSEETLKEVNVRLDKILEQQLLKETK